MQSEIQSKLNKLFKKTREIATEVTDTSFHIDRVASITSACESSLSEISSSDFIIEFVCEAAMFSKQVYDNFVPSCFNEITSTKYGDPNRICMTYLTESDRTFWIIFRGTQDIHDGAVDFSLATRTLFFDVFR